MRAENLLATLRERGASVAVDGASLRVEASRGTVTEELKEQLAQLKPELIRLLSRPEGTAAERVQEIADEHGLTVALLLEAAGEDWPELVSEPCLLNTFTDVLATRLARERGERPRGHATASFCLSCGPVWLFKEAPILVVGCPWCHVAPEARERMPRPRVMCSQCEHYIPDPIGDGGIGTCKLGLSGRPSDYPLYPNALRQCGSWWPKGDDPNEPADDVDPAPSPKGTGGPASI